MPGCPSNAFVTVPAGPSDVSSPLTTSRVTGAESVFDMAASPTALPSSIAGLTFSPHMTDPRTGFGKMQVSVWSSAGNRNLYDIETQLDELERDETLGARWGRQRV